jgi:hypothetical protein
MGMVPTPGIPAASIPSRQLFELRLRPAFLSVKRAKKKLFKSIKNLAKKISGYLERALITIHRSCG